MRTGWVRRLDTWGSMHLCMDRVAVVSVLSMGRCSQGFVLINQLGIRGGLTTTSKNLWSLRFDREQDANAASRRVTSRRNDAAEEKRRETK